jgi:hypothetical protein
LRLAANHMRGKRQPRQQHLTSLGGIAEADAHTVAACYDFWTKALKRLTTKKLSKPNRHTIDTALAARVKRPTKQQLKRQQSQDLKQNLQLAQQRVQKIKLEAMRVPPILAIFRPHMCFQEWSLVWRRT